MEDTSAILRVELPLEVTSHFYYLTANNLSLKETGTLGGHFFFEVSYQ